MTLNKYYNKLKIKHGIEYIGKVNGRGSPFEGYSQQVPKQVLALQSLIREENIIHAMEIGFNGGHSAEIFLKNNENLRLTSFDIGSHSYVHLGKAYIDECYPSRHTLILGDSRETVPEFASNNDLKFDLIFIDGGHHDLIPQADLENCKRLSHKNTIVIMDDTIHREEGWKASWNLGPTSAWIAAIENKSIIEIGWEDYSPGRGMSWGKYLI
jgi:predicted O-methyltransferase YrrM